MDVNRLKDSIKADIKAEMKPRKLLRTAFIPQTKGLMNPLKEVFTVFIAMIAQIFVQAKLISRQHPAFTKEATGFGAIWLMIVDASSNVKFKRENIYQIIVFYGIVGMLVFGALDLVAFLMHFTMGHAHAQTTNTASLFNESNTSDNAPNWINTMFPYANNQTNATGIPLALQTMLVTYNSALLALGTAFALYQVAHLFVESAHHGKFGGSRYSQLHAPLRLVIGIGLLVPTTYGFNSAQLIAIEMAKMGSGLASNVWQSFQNGLTSYTSQTPSVQASDINEIAQKLLVDETCTVAAESASNALGSGQHQAWNPIDTGNSYVVTFDDKTGDGYCGSITIPKQKSNQYTLAADNYFEQAFIGTGGGGVSDTTGILASIWTVANDIYHNSSGGTDPNGAQDPTLNPFNTTSCTGTYCAGKNWSNWIGMPTTSGGTVTNIIAQMQTAATNTANAYQTAAANNATSTSTISTDWTKAGYLFLKMTHDAADQGTAQNPTIDVSLPDSSVLNVASGSQTAGGGQDCSGVFSFLNYACDTSGKTVVVATAQAINNIRAAVPKSGMSVVSFTPNSNGAGNDGGGVLLKALSGPMNTLWNGIQQVTGVNVSTQSFGQSIFNVMQLGNVIMTVASGFVIGGALLGSTFMTVDDGLVVIGIGVAMFPIAFSLGIMIPLLPAGRFIFGLFTWILTLFEAIIAMPVVALISINFEGEGTFAHGKQGWFLLLQMMLRPVLMIFGLVGAVLIFDTLAGFITKSIFGVWFNMNTTAPSITTVIMAPMAGVSQVFQIIGFLYFYALTLWGCANMSFGLINTIPDRILSWTGLNGGFHTGNEMDTAVQGASSAASGMITGGAQSAIAIQKSHIQRDEALRKERAGEAASLAWQNEQRNLLGGPGVGGGGGGGGSSMDDMHGNALQMNKDRSADMDAMHGEGLQMNKDRDSAQQQLQITKANEMDQAHGEGLQMDKDRSASNSNAMNEAHGEGLQMDKDRSASNSNAMNQAHGEGMQMDKDRSAAMDSTHGEGLEMNKDYNKKQSGNIPKDNSDDYHGA